METMFIGQQLIETDIVDSTNNFATNLISATNVPEGTVIMAREQTTGKGQRGNSWLSEPGRNLTISIVLYPHFLLPRQKFFLSMAVSVAIHEALASQLDEIFIKWPNDIYAGKKKLGGILIENALSGNQIKSAIIGIGLNVNQLDFPGEINATSISLLTLKEEKLHFWLEKICQGLEAGYLALRSGQFMHLKKKYLESLLYINEERAFISNNLGITGKIRDVSEEGKLVIEHSDKIIAEYDIKEIRFLI